MLDRGAHRACLMLRSRARMSWPPPGSGPRVRPPPGGAGPCRGGRGIPSVTPASWTPAVGCWWALGRLTLACTLSVLLPLERSARSHRRVGPDYGGPTDRETGSECPCGGIEAPRCCCSRTRRSAAFRFYPNLMLVD